MAKLKDPNDFTISYSIGKWFDGRVSYSLGASIKPYSDFRDPVRKSETTSIILQFANRLFPWHF